MLLSLRRRFFGSRNRERHANAEQTGQPPRQRGTSASASAPEAPVPNALQPPKDRRTLNHGRLPGPTSSSPPSSRSASRHRTQPIPDDDASGKDITTHTCQTHSSYRSPVSGESGAARRGQRQQLRSGLSVSITTELSPQNLAAETRGQSMKTSPKTSQTRQGTAPPSADMTSSRRVHRLPDTTQLLAGNSNTSSSTGASGTPTEGDGTTGKVDRSRTNKGGRRGLNLVHEKMMNISTGNSTHNQTDTKSSTDISTTVSSTKRGDATRTRRTTDTDTTNFSISTDQNPRRSSGRQDVIPEETCAFIRVVAAHFPIVTMGSLTGLSSVTRAFCGTTKPEIPLTSYLERLVKYTNKSHYVDTHDVNSFGMNALIMATLYIERLGKKNPSFQVNDHNVHRLFFVGIVIATKMMEDNHRTNRFMSRVGGISIMDLISMETTFCIANDFNFFASPAALATKRSEFTALLPSNRSSNPTATAPDALVPV